jgi:hypothetical protein
LTNWKTQGGHTHKPLATIKIKITHGKSALSSSS